MAHLVIHAKNAKEIALGEKECARSRLADQRGLITKMRLIAMKGGVFAGSANPPSVG